MFFLTLSVMSDENAPVSSARSCDSLRLFNTDAHRQSAEPGPDEVQPLSQHSDICPNVSKTITDSFPGSQDVKKSRYFKPATEQGNHGDGDVGGPAHSSNTSTSFLSLLLRAVPVCGHRLPSWRELTERNTTGELQSTLSFFWLCMRESESISQCGSHWEQQPGVRT